MAEQTPLIPVLRNSIKSGLISSSAIAENEYPKDAVLESLNFHFDTIGQMTLRKGLTQLGNTLSGNILGLYNFRDSGSGTNNRMIAVNGTTTYYLAGSTWTSKRTGLTSGSKARFSTFLDVVFMVNGSDATATWDGNTANNFITTNNALNAPIGKFIENYRSRMWIAGNSTYPDRLYYSSLPSAVATPEISWDTNVSTGQWIDISPSDGENITGLHRTKGALLVFKNNHIYRVYSILQADPDPQFNVGTYSQESIVETKNGVYFHHPTGFYRYDGGVSEISRPIIDFVKGITLSNYSSVTGYLEDDGDHICWAVGDVTVDDIVYTNTVLRYTISTQVWTHYSYPTQFLVSSTYNDGSNLFILTGDTSGKIYKTNYGSDDSGTDLFYSIIHNFDDIDGSSSTFKTINKMAIIHKRMIGGNINYLTPDSNSIQFTKKIGQILNEDVGFNGLVAQGKKFKFRISGVAKSEPIIYEGYEILEGSTQLVAFRNQN